jgi:AMMECR1 domain-containing protein
MGRIARDVPLIEAVSRLTLAAALDDPRGSSAVIPEDVEVEISVLTPMKLVRGAEAIQVGKDGAYVEMGARRALILPQAAGHDWTAAAFLDALFDKAGVPRDECLTSKPRLFTFRAQVFRSDRAAAASRRTTTA